MCYAIKKKSEGYKVFLVTLSTPERFADTFIAVLKSKYVLAHFCFTSPSTLPALAGPGNGLVFSHMLGCFVIFIICSIEPSL
jgi:hypothetical protein